MPQAPANASTSAPAPACRAWSSPSRARSSASSCSRKRARFLEETSAALGLDNVRVLSGRAEVLAHQVEWRERFAFVTARAVAQLAVLAELCLPFLRVGGRFVAMKSGDTDELAAAQPALALLGAAFVEEEHYRLEGVEGGRSLVVCEARTATPKAYPRSMARIRKRALPET